MSMDSNSANNTPSGEHIHEEHPSVQPTNQEVRAIEIIQNVPEPQGVVEIANNEKIRSPSLLLLGAGTSINQAQVPAASPTKENSHKEEDQHSPPKRPRFDYNDDVGATCSICLNNWSDSGDHRVCSLKCGHLFGYSCVIRWFSTKPIPDLPE